MMAEKNIYLIGPMGSGKTSVGKQLSFLTRRKLIDSDQEIEQRTGVSITWIFSKEQESGFRKREEQLFAELTQQHNLIISTGGGSILSAATRQRLKTTGIVIFLKVSLEIQLARTKRRKGTRPLIQGISPEKKLAAINHEREPLYTQLADLIIETDRRTPKEIAHDIIKKLAE